MDSGNASVQPSLGLNWKGLTVYAWGSTEFREKNNEIDLSLEYEYKNLTLYFNNYFTQTEDEPFKYFNYRENGKRAWSSYCELSYPFNVKGVNLSIEAGFTPWESFYSNKFNVVNVGLSATKELKITSNFSLPIFGKLIANPYEEQVYFVFGITL